MRRRQNNPILTGEAGVGKTAVVEGFALRVAQGDVPPPLRNVIIRTLDLALLQAGAGIKGEFENRLKGLIEEVKASPTPIILFIDEAHTMIGAGGAAGQGDAANLLKPALARGELRTIAATTWSEYKKYFEKDPALARRFQVVKVEEPIETQCLTMLRGIVPSLEKHHKVRILDEGLTAAVHLSHRYLAGRQLPDKAVSVLDTACARLALGQSATPPAIEDSVRQIDDLAVQQRILERESLVGTDHRERLQEIATKSAEIESRLAGLRTRFEKESGLVTTIRDLRSQLETAAASQNGNAALARTEIPGVATDASASAPTAPTTAAEAAASSATATAVAEARQAGGRGRRPHATRAGRSRTCSPARRSAHDSRRRRCANCRRSNLRLDRNPGGENDEGRNLHRPLSPEIPRPTRDRPAARPGNHQPANLHLARPSRRSQQADRRVHAGRPQRRRQNRNRARPVRSSLRRRTQPHHHQHVGVPGRRTRSLL